MSCAGAPGGRAASDDRRPPQLDEWNDALDQDDVAINRIARWVAKQIAAQGGGTTARRWNVTGPSSAIPRTPAVRYLTREGLPCGSGATEGAYKSGS
jgi:hypothetical protein